MINFIKKVLVSPFFLILASLALLAAIVFGVYTAHFLQLNSQIMANAVTMASTATPYYPDYPPINAAGKDAALLQRGEYLTKAGDCIACHTNTPAKGKTFAGGLPIPTPFGTIYSPNITPDKDTGIGGWTDAQFIKAMRHGISPEGEYYYPAFPFYYFNQVSTEDLHAMKAYLDSIPAVHQVNTENTMAFPFNIRLLQLGWRIMFLHPKTEDGYHQDAQQSAQWNRGAYLVEGLGHCAMCHTPSYYLLSKEIPLAAPIDKYALTGAPVQGYMALNISKSGLGDIPVEKIVGVFLKNQLTAGGQVVGPMLEVNHDSLSKLNEADLTAIATYLQTVNSKMPPKVKSSGNPGEAVYQNYCFGCHAMGAGGAPKMGDSVTWDKLMQGGKDKVYYHAIHGINGMPPKGTCSSCSDQEIKQAVDYMALTKAPAGSTETTPAPVTPLTMEDGKKLYEKNCSSCHAAGVNNAAPKLGDMTAWQPVIEAGFMAAYENIETGKKGHPVNGGCKDCSDAEIKAALKYLMQENSHNNYSLW
jgi:cytochrome c5